MKNNTINLILICIAYFAIGLLLANNHIQNKTLKLTQDSIEKLVIIEMITKNQFDILQDKVKELENNDTRRITHIGK